MKKVFALMLALVIALSASLAFAEQTKEASPAGLVLTSSIDVERSAVGEIMDNLGADGDRRAIMGRPHTLQNEEM